MNEKAIVSEIREKADSYEAGTASFMASVGEWGDIFQCKAPPRKAKAFSNPRLTEMFRATTAVGTLMYRMMTAADPFYNAVPVDVDADYNALETVKHVWKAQLKYAGYRANLLRACHYAPLFGTVICQEDYRIVGVSAHGRKMPVTTLTPRTLDQVFFDRGAQSFDDAEWVATSDITGKADLMRLAAEAKQLDAPWNMKALEAAAKEEEQNNTINSYVLSRMQRAGYNADEALKSKKELLFFTGKLDAMNDGLEYVAVLVNRRHLVRFHAHNFQHGRRNFRVAKWVDFMGPLGLGYGQLFSRQHKSMEGNRQRGQDVMAFGAYGMWQRVKGSVDDADCIIGPMRFIGVDRIGDIAPLTPDLRAAQESLALDQVLKQEFRAATHATDTLQAIASDTTATAASLSSNEGLRAVGVHAEQIAEPLVRQHIENLHANNAQNINAPFNVNVAGVARRVYPAQLRMDLDVEAITTTDKDFDPKRLDKLINVLQILTSTKSQHPDQMQISVLPVVKELAYMLDVNPDQVILPAPRMMLGAPSLSGPDMVNMAQMSAPGAGGGVNVVNTPVGPTLASA